MYILGISALYHDSAAVILKDGEIIAAAQEERFTRVKHDSNFPQKAITYCILEADITVEDIDIVVFYDNPILTLDRYISNVISAGEKSKELINANFELNFGERVWINKIISNFLGECFCGRIKVCEHHISHSASAFYPSPFQKAVVITIDGVGEWATTTIGVGDGKKLDVKEEIDYPNSLGLLYSAFTYYCGFKVNSGDYKFMGLAPYGRPIYKSLIFDNIVHLNNDGSFELNLKYFEFQYGRTMISNELEKLFGHDRRKPESTITQHEMDVAASVQSVIEEIIIKIVQHAKNKWGKGIDNLCLAGGVALNCVANGKIRKQKIFKNIWIQPAAGDAGGALGAALYAYYEQDYATREIDLNNDKDFQKGSYLGPSFTNEQIKEFLDLNGYLYRYYSDELLYDKIAQNLANGSIIGLFHGKMEFGPRALGNRSIIADPRSEKMQSKINLKIKFRESFRPFAPSVLEEDCKEYFDLEGESPYMLLVDKVKKERCIKQNIHDDLKNYGMDMLKVVNKKRSDISAVTHVDYSARIQTVSRETNKYFYRVIEEFKKITKCSVIVNTSFNVRGEPIVCTPKDAYNCFMRTDMDILVLENYILYKEEQPKYIDDEKWKNIYKLD